MNRTAKIKLLIVAILVVIVVIVVFQNAAPVTTKILLVDVEMPRALLLFVTLAIGFVAGLVAASSFAGKRRK